MHDPFSSSSSSVLGSGRGVIQMPRRLHTLTVLSTRTKHFRRKTHFHINFVCAKKKYNYKYIRKLGGASYIDLALVNKSCFRSKANCKGVIIMIKMQGSLCHYKLVARLSYFPANFVWGFSAR